MKTAALALIATLALLATGTAFAGEPISSEVELAGALSVNSTALHDARAELGGVWSRVRAARGAISELSDRPEQYLPAVRAELQTLRAEMEDCRGEILALRTMKRGLLDERVVLRGLDAAQIASRERTPTHVGFAAAVAR